MHFGRTLPNDIDFQKIVSKGVYSGQLESGDYFNR